MMRALTGLTVGAVFVVFCVSSASAKPRCTDGCRTRGPSTTGRTTRNPWRMSDKDRKDYLEERFGDYRDEFYGGGGQKTLDKLRDKLGPYKDFWNKWRHDYKDLPRGSKERDTVVKKLRWVRDVLRGARDLKNEFEASLASNRGASEGTDGGSGGNGGTTPSTGGTDTSAPAGGTTTSTPGTGTSTPTGDPPGDKPAGSKHGESLDPLSYLLWVMADQEKDPEVQALLDNLLAEGFTRGNLTGESEATLQRVIKSLKDALQRMRQGDSQSGSK